jgi:hypothetical protein
MGRNEPCPCGSGRKYKKCCGAKSDTNSNHDQDIACFQMNQEIAYQGRIGQQREDFCISYIEKKQKILGEIEKAQIREATTRGETITCKKGCSFCCLLHVEATLQECEAIVYYLYQHKPALSAFLRQYPLWREQINKKGDLFKKLGQLSRDVFTCEYSGQTSTPEYIKERQQAYAEAEKRYAMQNIPCPFLHNHACSIYEVRPYNCACFLATTPYEWCNPSNPNEPKVYRSRIPADVVFDLSFYYKRLRGPVFSFMPLVVYEILKGGFLYLSPVPGLESLEHEALNDPEVRAILRKYL